MRPSPVIPPPQVLILDTGPLRELVAYSAVHTLQFERLRGELRHLISESSYRSLAEFIVGFRRKTTTPHVVAEISSWVHQTRPKSGAPAIWSVVFTELLSMRMDEGLVKLLEMPQELVADIGATDAGILELALRFGRAESMVVSMDERLIAKCKSAGVMAQDLWQVIAS